MLSGFHFSSPGWLWALILLVPAWLLPFNRRGSAQTLYKVKSYADAKLLPLLIVPPRFEPGSGVKPLINWSLLWCLAVLAMAGPRWDYAEVKVYQSSADVVVLFDLSRSMLVEDVKPSRLARARQEVEDLLSSSEGLRFGLVGFASVSHVVAPVTEDSQTLSHLLPALTPNLIRLQGSRLSAALDQAERLLLAQPKTNSKAIVLVTDGDFDEPGLVEQVAAMRAKGMRLHILGLGTATGGLVPGPGSGALRDANGKAVLSKLDGPALQALAQAGGGLYVAADYRDLDSQQLLNRLYQDVPMTLEENPLRIWHERFYLLLIPMMLLLLGRFRSEIGVER